MIFVKRQICILAHKKEQLFGKVVDGTVQLSPVVEIVHEQWLKNPTNFSNVLLDTFVIMPNHIRRNGILVITDSTVHTGKGKAFSPDFAKSGENALPFNRCFSCAPGGTRTPNQLIRSQALYPLSYEGIYIPIIPQCPISGN